MNAQTIISDDMSLEEKLAAIDAAVADAMAASQAGNVGTVGATTTAAVAGAPVDPATLLMCDGCQ